MYRMALAIVAFIMVISFLALRVVIAQTMSEETEVTSPASEAPSQGTDVLESPPNAPLIDDAGRVYPREDLNPFGLSTLGRSTESGERKEGSTLGVTTKRKSNLEVNKPREKKEVEETAQEEVESSGEATVGVAGEESTEVIPEEPTEVLSPSSLSKSSGLYKWVDKNGVVHATNNLGSVPPEYRDQLTNEPEKGEGEKVSQPQDSEESSSGL